ncbi:MAG: mechanosensitive ion channel [Candidatus Promineifilaceae bacterium]|nr:mechanosensitive ion channel [Candidatus Promineifilaceae bacterium]
MPLDPEFWTETLSDIVADVVAFVPTLVVALIWLILGWLVARVAQFILSNVLRRLGLDRIAERAGVTPALNEAGLDPSVSYLLARLVYWLVLLVFVLAAAESLGLEGVVETLRALVGYLPSVLAAALILLLGSLIARVVGDGLGALAVQSGLNGGLVLGQIVRYVLLIFAIILALGQLGIETTLLTTVTIVLITAVALALALALGIGSRDLARNIMAGMHAKDSFVVGQQLSVRGHTGRLVSIGTVKATLETEAGLVSLPNAILTEEEVTVLSGGRSAQGWTAPLPPTEEV